MTSSSDESQYDQNSHSDEKSLETTNMQANLYDSWEAAILAMEQHKYPGVANPEDLCADPKSESGSWGTSHADLEWLHTRTLPRDFFLPPAPNPFVGWDGEYVVPEKKMIDGFLLYDDFYGNFREWNPETNHTQFVCCERITRRNYHIIFANAFRKIGVECVFEGKEYIHTYWYPGDGYVHEKKIKIFTNESGQILLEISSGHLQGYVCLIKIMTYFLQCFKIIPYHHTFDQSLEMVTLAEMYQYNPPACYYSPADVATTVARLKDIFDGFKTNCYDRTCQLTDVLGKYVLYQTEFIKLPGALKALVDSITHLVYDPKQRYIRKTIHHHIHGMLDQYDQDNGARAVTMILALIKSDDATVREAAQKVISETPRFKKMIEQCLDIAPNQIPYLRRDAMQLLELL
jgi:hypothetical protein